jgi:hypothetical protein
VTPASAMLDVAPSEAPARLTWSGSVAAQTEEPIL